MKPERLIKAPENAGINEKWYQEPTREGDDSLRPSSSRASDSKGSQWNGQNIIRGTRNN